MANSMYSDKKTLYEGSIVDVPGVLTVHYLDSPKNKLEYVVWLLEEYNVPYKLKGYTPVGPEIPPVEFSMIYPVGNSPRITDGDIVVAGFSAITEYVVKKYGNREVDAVGWLDDLNFRHYAEGTLQHILARKAFVSQRVERKWYQPPSELNIIFTGADKLLQNTLRTHGTFIETHLAKTGGLFAGGNELTVADYMMYPCLESFITRDPANVGARSKAFVTSIRARPAYKRALQKLNISDAV